MPPSVDRGKGWLFDPRLTDTPEVKAQIRVSLKQERQKKKILIVRSMQLAHTLDKQRRLKPQFKVRRSCYSFCCCGCLVWIGSFLLQAHCLSAYLFVAAAGIRGGPTDKG